MEFNLKTMYDLFVSKFYYNQQCIYPYLYILCVRVCVRERVHFQVCESPCQGGAMEVRRHWFSRTR